ncbi:MAG: hypothetical protein ABI416_10685 [Ginsengibacter sp.]
MKFYFSPVNYYNEKLQALSILAILCTFGSLSCVHGNESGYTNFGVDESDHYYSMRAYFSESKTREVDEYMEHRIGKRSDMTFVNSWIDGKPGFNDHTTFYIKKILVSLK